MSSLEKIKDLKKGLRLKYYKITDEAFEDIFQNALIAYSEKEKVEKIEFPKTFFYWLMRGQYSNLMTHYNTERFKATECLVDLHSAKMKQKNEAEDLSHDVIPDLAFHYPDVFFRKILVREIESMPESQREVAVLHLFEGMTPAEISQYQGSKYDTCKSNLRYAMARLQKKFKKYYEMRDL